MMTGQERDENLALKIDRLITKLDLMAEEVAKHEKILYGEDGEFGLVHQVKVIWRAHVWVLCSLSAALGAVGAMLVDWIVK